MSGASSSLRSASEGNCSKGWIVDANRDNSAGCFDSLASASDGHAVAGLYDSIPALINGCFLICL